MNQTPDIELLGRSRRGARRPCIGITSWQSSVTSEDAVALGRDYVEAVLAAGGLPLVLPVLDPVEAADVLGALDGLVLTGGGDVDPARYGAEAVPEVYGVDPARDAWELELARTAQVPVLGICRGAQVLNVAAGGTLLQHLPAVTDLSHRERERSTEVVHPVAVEPGSLLHGIVGADHVGVNTLHHQAVEQPGAGLRVVASAPDGTVEAIEGSAERLVLGVQWHPELLRHVDAHAALFAWLVGAAADGWLAAAVA